MTSDRDTCYIPWGCSAGSELQPSLELLPSVCFSAIETPAQLHLGQVTDFAVSHYSLKKKTRAGSPTMYKHNMAVKTMKHLFRWKSALQSQPLFHFKSKEPIQTKCTVLYMDLLVSPCLLPSYTGAVLGIFSCPYCWSWLSRTSPYRLRHRTCIRLFGTPL